MLAICALQQFIQFVHYFMQDQNISQTPRILNKFVIHFVVTVFYFLHHILWKVVLLKLFVLSLRQKKWSEFDVTISTSQTNIVSLITFFYNFDAKLYNRL